MTWVWTACPIDHFSDEIIISESSVLFSKSVPRAGGDVITGSGRQAAEESSDVVGVGKGDTGQVNAVIYALYKLDLLYRALSLWIKRNIRCTG